MQLEETLALDAALGHSDNARTTFGAPFLEFWESKKRPKFSTFYNNF